MGIHASERKIKYHAISDSPAAVRSTRGCCSVSNMLLNQVEQGKQKFSQPHPPPVVLLWWLLHFQGTGLLAKTCLRIGNFQRHPGQLVAQLPHPTLPISGSRCKSTQSDKTLLLLGLFSPCSCTYWKVEQTRNRVPEWVSAGAKGEMDGHLLSKRMSRRTYWPTYSPVLWSDLV